MKTVPSDNNRIPIGPGDEIMLGLAKPADTVQWRSNHLRDDWANLHSYNHDTTTIALDYNTVMHQLEHLPGKTLNGNHTLSMRAIEGESSSPLISFDIVMTDTGGGDSPEDDADSIVGLSISIAVIILVVTILILGIIRERQEIESVNLRLSDETVMAAELVE